MKKTWNADARAKVYAKFVHAQKTVKLNTHVENVYKFLCIECVSASKENDCGYGKVMDTIFNKFMQIFLSVIYEL
jgi:hypothetical protein